MGIFSTIANIGMGLSTIAGSANNAELTDYNLAKIEKQQTTEVQTVKAKTAFDSNAFMVEMKAENVLKSREKLNNPYLDDKTAYEIMKQGQQMLDLLAGLDGDALKQKMTENGITLEDIQEIYKKLGQVSDYWENRTNGAQTQIMKANNDKTENKATNRWVIAGTNLTKTIKEYNSLNKIIYTLKAQAEAENLAKLRETAVSSIDQIPNNPKLKDLKEKMKMTFETNSRGEIVVKINEADTHFKAFKPKYDKSYTILLDNGENPAIIFEKIKKDGRISYQKFVFNKTEVVATYKDDDEKWEIFDSYALTNKTVAQN